VPDPNGERQDVPSPDPGLPPVGVWGHLATLPAEGLRPFTERVASLGYGALWVAESAGREPFALLGALAASAGGMWLGTSIVNVFGRDAMAARMGAMTMHELTAGRFVLGLGVSHHHLVEKLRGHRYERPWTRMREFLEEYRRLPYRGPLLPEGSAPPEPPVLLAALRRRMLELSATAADGAFPYLIAAPRVGWMRRVLDDAASGSGRRPVLAVTLPVALDADPAAAREKARAYLPPYLRAPNYQASLAEQGFEAADWEPPYSDRIVDALVACGDESVARGRLDEMLAQGADHVALIPLDDVGGGEDLPTLEALAPRR
jgi:probable F420-dependent oxidoreductase